MLTRIKKWHLRIDTVMASVSAGLVLLMTLAGTIDVLGRYLFNKPIAGTLEGMEFAMGGVAFFAFAYVQYMRGHITVPIVRQRLSGRGAALLDITFLILMLLTFVLVSWLGGKAAIEACQAGDVTIGLVEFPVGPARMVVPIGGGFLCLRLFSQVCEAIAKFSRSNRGA